MYYDSSRFREDALARIEHNGRRARKESLETPRIARVNCMASRHTLLLQNGRLILEDHSEEDDEELNVLALLDPSFRCRCQEIRVWWRIYITQGRLSHYEMAEKYPWMPEALGEKKYDMTPSVVLAQLPKDFREDAKYALKIRESRSSRLSQHRVHAPQTVVERYSSDWNRRRALTEVLKRKIARILQPGVKTDGESLPLGNEREVRQVLKEYRDSVWFQTCTSAALFPMDIPTPSQWPDGFPPAFLALRWEQPKYQTVWICLSKDSDGFTVYAPKFLSSF